MGTLDFILKLVPNKILFVIVDLIDLCLFSVVSSLNL